MRQIIKALGFLAALLPSLAVAQTQLPTVAPGTLLGRLPGPTSGPAYAIPFNVFLSSAGYVTLPVVSGNLACFNGTTGQIHDCGSSPSTVPLTVGTTPIVSGASKGLLYNNAGVLGNVATANSGMLVTSASGVPSISNIVGGDAFFGSGRPWCDVRAKGATGDGHTDDAAAVQACVTAVQTFGSGGTVYFPASNGPYCIQSMINITGVPVVFKGENQNVSVHSCAADITVFKLNAPGSAIIDLAIYGKGTVGLPTADTVFGATNPTVWMGSSCVNCVLDHIKVQGGSNTIKSEAGDSKIYRSEAGSAYGGANVYIAAGMWLERNAFDQNWPVSFPAYPLTANAWAATTAYTVGQVVSTAGYYIQCLTAGTSGGTAPALKNYGTSITDGTAVWLLVAPTTYYGVQADTGASEVNMLQQDLSGPFTAGLAMTNTLAGLAPSYISIGTGSVIGQTFTAGVFASTGSELVVDGLHIAGGVLSGSYGVVLSNTFAGRARIVNNTFLTGTGNGVGIQAGVSTVVANNHINTNTGNAVVVAANINDFVIAGNTIEPNNLNGIVVQAGTSNHYAIYGNINTGVSGSMYLDSGTGTDKVVIASMSGNTSKVVTTTGTLTSGDCVKIDANGNFVANGSACGGGGAGTVNAGTINQLAYYAANGTAVSGETLLQASNFPALTGDVTTSAGAVATAIGTNKVTRGMQAQGIARSVIGVTGNAGANVADIQGTANQALVVNSAGTALAFGAVNLASSAGATGVIQAASFPALTGDVTTVAGALASTLATVNANVGSFGSATNCVTFTTNAKGLITAASQTTCTPAIASLTGAGTGVLTALGIAVNTSGGVVTGGSSSAGDIMISGGSGNPIAGGTGCAIAAGGSIQCTTSSSSLPQYILTNTANNLGDAAILFKKSRVSGDTLANDFIGETEYYGFANSGYNLTGLERFIQTGASVGSNIPSKWTLSTSNTAGSTNQTLTFDQNAHLGVTAQATAPTITAGCSGAGSAVGTGSSDAHGWITGSTAAATTCTITFGTAFTNRPACTVSGEQSAILTMTPGTATLVVTFASTANYKFDWVCMGQ